MKTILIIGERGIGKTTCANVIAQIAQQHHGKTTEIRDADDPIKYGKPMSDLLVICQRSDLRHKRVPANYVINLDKFKNPRGRNVTFVLREAIEHCLAAA